MGQKIVVGPSRGLRTDITPFNIDNDSFPTLVNAYQWRGRVKRKRGTSLLGRLRRFFDSTNVSYSSTATIALDGAGNANLLTGFSLESDGNIVPGSVTITIGVNVYTDPTEDGYLTPTGTGGPNTINYATGAILIPAEAGNNASASFNYYPDLPVMGLRDLILSATQFPGTIGFDTTYAYNIITVSPYSIYDVSFYKNPSTGTYAGYVQKTNWTPVSWNGQDYQQFWSVNYQGAFWATNGVNVPFTVTNFGMQYNTITAIGAIVAGPPAFATITTGSNHGLVIGDFVFINEVTGTLGNTINFQTGYVTAVPALNQITVEFPDATLAGAYVSGGIVQYLTNRSDVTKDCIRWYDGDPTDGNADTPTLSSTKGWVNFCPPISRSDFSIANLPPDQYYLIGAKMIVPFKDRLLFIGPVVQTSAAGSQTYLQDTIIYSQNGTAFYTASFTGDPSSVSTEFNQILVPNEQTATPGSYWSDQTGFGGFVTAGIDEPIFTAGSNEDVLILGMTTNQLQLVYTGNDVVPFNFFIINSELGSNSTFSSINMDQGVITKGSRGFVIANQASASRIDLEIPDQIFEIQAINNGTERVCSQRDYINEWIYFTYSSNQFRWKFPTQTLQYNYRDNSWAIFNECYTTYGTFKKQSGFTWATVGTVYPTWSAWNAPWNAGSSTLLQPEVIAGNQQGFVLVRDDGTNEGNSLYVQSFSGSTVTSPDHCLNNGDYIVFDSALGTIGSQVNGKVFSVYNVTTDTFKLNPNISFGTYFGGGVIKRMYVPFIQTKQFPLAWSDARKIRLGPQMYMFTTTDVAQIQLLIYLSQNAASPYNGGAIVPSISSINNSLIYSTVLYTCPESTNLGLTPSNTNLQMPTAIDQDQIWHRINTSLLGDTVQIGFTMSDEQMRAVDANGNPISQFAEIELHGMILDVSPSMLLA